MADFTVKDALSIRGTDPQNLFEKIVRTRIHDSLYWKEHCFGLNASGIIDKAIEINCIGGCYGDDLLNEDRICNTTLPRISKRSVLEDNGDLSPRVSALELEDASGSNDDSGNDEE
ncbi:hypothetical protein BB559_002466 [Furculomyces boomerangus]|uniref:Pre-mRNA-splicing factor 38 n=1 Tax=Furculomyces boomerangus TaxID=61424 RepID=A0A2T9YVC7_9FUNG|nr:hypothetical protein BB559_002466 [Furculomyces boomerangus]